MYYFTQELQHCTGMGIIDKVCDLPWKQRCANIEIKIINLIKMHL